MTQAAEIATEYERRKGILSAAGYRVHEFGYGDLLVVEMSVWDELSGKTLIRKQEGIAIQGRTPFLVECRKLMALERLSNTVPRMWVVSKLRSRGEARRD